MDMVDKDKEGPGPSTSSKDHGQGSSCEDDDYTDGEADAAEVTDKVTLTCL